MKGERFASGDKRTHPWVSPGRIHGLRNEADTLTDSEDMGIDRERVPSKTEEKEAVDGLGTDPL
jgi:hypothetical protein